MAQTREQRVAAYVDSRAMVQRLHVGPLVAAAIRGSMGRYRVKLDAKTGEGSCTCPSEIQPCKHIEAVRLTWRKKPESFMDVDALLDVHLQGRDRDELVRMMRAMVLESPPALAALGALQFRDVEDRDDSDE